MSKPIIRKKDKNTSGEQRYILQWEEHNQIKTWGFTASKLLDSIKKSKIIKENVVESGLQKPMN